MNIMAARETIDKLAHEYFAIGENASEAEFRKAYSKMESNKELFIHQDNFRLRRKNCGNG